MPLDHVYVCQIDRRLNFFMKHVLFSFDIVLIQSLERIVPFLGELGGMMLTCNKDFELSKFVCYMYYCIRRNFRG